MRLLTNSEAQFCSMKTCSLALTVCTAARRFLLYEFYKCDPCKTLLQTTGPENRAIGYCEGGANKFLEHCAA